MVLLQADTSNYAAVQNNTTNDLQTTMEGYNRKGGDNPERSKTLIKSYTFIANTYKESNNAFIYNINIEGFR